MRKALFILRSSKNFITTKALKAIYYSLFHSNLIYCISIWSSTPQCNLNKIITLQKSAVRLICNEKYNAHTEPIFKKLSILPFRSLVDFFGLQFMQRFKQGFLPTSFLYTWASNEERRPDLHHYNLRNNDLLNIPFHRLSSSALHPFVKFPRLWLEFQDENIKILREKSEFNSKLKNHFLNNLSSVVVCTRLLCPTCHLSPWVLYLCPLIICYKVSFIILQLFLFQKMLQSCFCSTCSVPCRCLFFTFIRICPHFVVFYCPTLHIAP